MPNTNDHTGHTGDFLTSLYRTIRTIRRFEEIGMERYRAGDISGYFHTCIGQEGIAAGACAAIKREDYIVSTHRGHGHCIAKGADINRMMAELFGRETGYSKGRGGSMHIADRETGNIGANGIVGGGIPLAIGVGMGIKVEASDRVVICFFGDGASNNGVFAESLNIAAVHSLPVIFLLENNCYAATTSLDETSRCIELAPRGEGYGVETVTVKGNDPLDIHTAVSRTADTCRNGRGPVLIEAMTHRFYGHHVNDDASYVPDDLKASWEGRDPLDITVRHMKNAGIGETEIEALEREVEAALERAVKFAEESPEPDGDAFLASVAEYDC